MGHTDEEAVRLGIISAEDREGNREADEAAGLACCRQRPEVTALARLYNWRHKAYKATTKRIQDFVAKIKLADIEESFDQQRRRLPSGFQGRARHTPEDRLEPWDLLEVGFQLAQVNFLHLGGVGVDQLGLQPPGQIPEPYELASEDAGPVLPP